MDIPRGTTQIGMDVTGPVMGSGTTIQTVNVPNSSTYHSGGYPVNTGSSSYTNSNTSTDTSSPDKTLLIIIAIAVAVVLYIWLK